MSIFDAINVAEQAMSVHRLRSEVAGENVANAYTPGYRAKHVVLQANGFQDALSRANGGVGGGSGGTAGAVGGAVRVSGMTLGDGNPDNARQEALASTVEMMQSKSAFELNMRAATMLKSMALSSLEIGRGG